MNNLKIELHLLQNFPPSCLNRDDANMPKECDFGGVRRARISSQCMKRTARERFSEVGSLTVGERTRQLKRELRGALGGDESINPIIDVFLAAFYSGMDKDGERTTVLTFVSRPEIAEATRCISDYSEALSTLAKTGGKKKPVNDDDAAPAGTDKRSQPKLPVDIAKRIKERLKAARLSADIALFGRMLAENPDFNCNAACQVAHAISTHAVNPETDFFTAVDDLNKDDMGAGMMGIQGFNSACFYRYAAIDRPLLISNLAGDTALADRAIRAFLEASVDAVPMARKNGSGQNVVPSLGVFVVRSSGIPISLANAFASPVQPEENLIVRSKERLSRYFQRLQSRYGAFDDADSHCFHDGEDGELGALSEFDRVSVKAAIDATMASVEARGQAA